MKLPPIILLLLVCSYSSAQETISGSSAGLQINTIPVRNTVNYNPFGSYWDEEKDLYSGPGLTVKDHSFSAGVTYSRTRKDNRTWRVRAGVIRTSIESNWSYVDPSFYYAYTAQKKELDYYISPGLYRTFSAFRFSYYVGMEVPVTVYGPADVSKAYSYFSVSTGEMLYRSETTGKISNGYSFGLAPFAGFTISIYDNLAFGPEVGFGLLFSDYGSRGEFSTSTVNGSSYYTAEHFDTGYRKAGITQPYGSFIVSWRFRG